MAVVKQALVLAMLTMVLVARLQAGELSWSTQGSGAALHSGAPERSLVLAPDSSQPLHGRISRVQLSFRYAGRALLKSQLCHQASGLCVPIQASTLDTSAFAGLPADSRFVLRQSVWSWAGPAYPVYVQAQLNVQYR